MARTLPLAYAGSLELAYMITQGTHDAESAELAAKCAEHAYLIARGTRMIAVLGTCKAESEIMVRMATQIEAVAEPPAIAFVIDQGDGSAVYGYAAYAWALDLYHWIVTTRALPRSHVNRVVGMLHGYSADAIRGFEERDSGRQFTSGITESVVPASS